MPRWCTAYTDCIAGQVSRSRCGPDCAHRLLQNGRSGTGKEKSSAPPAAATQWLPDTSLARPTGRCTCGFGRNRASLTILHDVDIVPLLATNELLVGEVP